MIYIQLATHIMYVYTIKKMTKKCIFALRLPSKSSFTLSKLRFFRLRKP